MDIDSIFEQIRALRHPESGCPWDRAQTLATSARHIREEAEELAVALEGGDAAAIREEAGDLLWNLCFAITLAEAEDLFAREEVKARVHEKMTRRHPHVFGTVRARTPEEALAFFRQAKAEEKGRAGEEKA